jgi:hypothetical protein
MKYTHSRQRCPKQFGGTIPILKIVLLVKGKTKTKINKWHNK